MNGIERQDVPGIRRAMKGVGAIVAEVDCQLRYVWIDNPHPGFQPDGVVGKRDDELIAPEDAHKIQSLKQDAFHRREVVSRTLKFNRSGGVRYYRLTAFPIRGSRGQIDGLLTVGFDTQQP